MVMECCFRFYEMSHLINFIHFFLHLFVVRRQIGPADAREFSRRCNFRFRKRSLPSRAVATIPGPHRMSDNRGAQCHAWQTPRVFSRQTALYLIVDIVSLVIVASMANSLQNISIRKPTGWNRFINK